MNTVLVVQARLGSSRFPGKVLEPVGPLTVLELMLARLRARKSEMTLVLAIPDTPSDDALVSVAEKLGVELFRGHPTDLLDRHYRAALAFKADTVVKIPSDCPLIDPGVVDQVMGFWSDHAGQYDYVSNLHPGSWPDGMDVEVFTMDALTVAHREAEHGFEREHTTPFFWENPARFRVGNVSWMSGEDLSMTHRWVVDYPEDLALVRAVYHGVLSTAGVVAGVDEIVEWLRAHPEAMGLNEKYVGVNWYRDHLHELKTVDGSMTRKV